MMAKLGRLFCAILRKPQGIKDIPRVRAGSVSDGGTIKECGDKKGLKAFSHDVKGFNEILYKDLEKLFK